MDHATRLERGIKRLDAFDDEDYTDDEENGTEDEDTEFSRFLRHYRDKPVLKLFGLWSF